MEERKEGGKGRERGREGKKVEIKWLIQGTYASSSTQVRSDSTRQSYQYSSSSKTIAKQTHKQTRRLYSQCHNIKCLLNTVQYCFPFCLMYYSYFFKWGNALAFQHNPLPAKTENIPNVSFQCCPLTEPWIRLKRCQKGETMAVLTIIISTGHFCDKQYLQTTLLFIMNESYL